MNNRLIMEKNPNSKVSEYIRKLRTTIQNKIQKEDKVILITSSIEKEGKSFITSNLAVAFAKIGYKVLIIDSDIKNPTQNQIFNIENNIGLSEVLDDIKLLKKSINETDIENISVLKSGIEINNFNEKLTTDKFKNLMETLKDSYDLILIDSRSIKDSDDPIVISNIVDKILIVSTILKTTPSMLKSTKQVLKHVDNKILGLVVNKSDE